MPGADLSVGPSAANPQHQCRFSPDDSSNIVVSIIRARVALPYSHAMTAYCKGANVGPRRQPGKSLGLYARVPTRCSGRRQAQHSHHGRDATSWPCRKVVPTSTRCDAIRRHSSVPGLQVVPGTSVAMISGGHHRLWDLDNTYRARRQPSALLRAPSSGVPRSPRRAPTGLRTHSRRIGIPARRS